MGSTTFTSGTVINNAWLVDVNSLVWGVFNGATTAALARTALGGVAGIFPISLGGTGQTTAAAAFTALSPTSVKGDLVAFSSLPVRLGVGANGTYLVADSTTTTGLKWGQTTEPTRTTLTSGSGTYTVPTGVTRIFVRLVGGGGGGGASTTNNGTVGNTTTFGTLTGNGGTAGLANGVAGAAGGTASGGDLNLQGGAGNAGGQNSVANVLVPGGMGGVSPFGGAGGGGCGGGGSGAIANTGSGGGGGGGNSGTNSGGGGGAGGYVEKSFVTPAATYSYSVAAVANGGAAGVQGGGTGGSGIIIIDEYYN